MQLRRSENLSTGLLLGVKSDVDVQNDEKLPPEAEQKKHMENTCVQHIKKVDLLSCFYAHMQIVVTLIVVTLNH